jgi:hypothetical protein
VTNTFKSAKDAIMGGRGKDNTTKWSWYHHLSVCVWDICRKWNLRNKLMFLNWDIGPYFGIFLCRNSCFLIGILVRTSESFYADILKYPVRKKAFCRKIFAWTSW